MAGVSRCEQEVTINFNGAEGTTFTTNEGTTQN